MSAELAGNTYLPKDPDEFVSWAFKQRGGLQLIADRIRRAEIQLSEARIAFAAYKAINGKLEDEILFLDKRIRSKNELIDKLVEVLLSKAKRGE